jgi:urease accessory protein UreE
MTQIINAFGLDYPVDQWARVTTIEKDPVLQEMLERSGDTIDVWSSEFILARTHYAKKHNLMK